MAERGDVGFLGGGEGGMGMGLYGDASKRNMGMDGLVGGVARFDSLSIHLIQVVNLSSFLFSGTDLSV